MTENQNFNKGDKVVYPSHGVGEIQDIEVQSIAGHEINVYVINFPQDKMVLRIPVNRAKSTGLRSVINREDLDKVYSTLQGKPRTGNKMWSRRAQEFETKINSGDITQIAEVLRDLYKENDGDRSYSERTIYEEALSRLSTELSILEDIPHNNASDKLVEVLKTRKVA
jgi:CarD family transcriptional regulator